jgi:hypothetical protein
MINTLHLGENIVISDREVIGFFSDPGGNSAFLEACGARLLLRNVTEKKRSFVVAGRKNRQYVYFSKISGRNLIKRLKEFSALSCDYREEVNG